jgi:glutathione synthase/RimK-type ligase-like ATP-grasp enzyme
MKKIIALTVDKDFHTLEVRKNLRRIGADLIQLKRNSYGKEWILTVLNGNRINKIFLETKKEIIPLKKIGSIWNRRDFSYLAKEGQNPIQNYINNQKTMHVNGLIRYLGKIIPTMNDMDANYFANTKLHQAYIAKKEGFLIPETFQGSSPRFANYFLKKNKGDICIKPLEAINLRLLKKKKILIHYTSKFKKRGLNKLSSLKLCPVILQTFINKSYEIRATVVGNKIFAASIDTSNASESAKVDWRHYDWKNTPYYKIKLPNIINEKLLKINHKLGLVYGAYDLIKSTTGEYYFLEVNPLGQWLWVEDLTGLKISEGIASWLFTQAKKN